jgi:thermitase
MRRWRGSGAIRVACSLLAAVFVVVGGLLTPMVSSAGPLSQVSSGEPGTRFVTGEILIKLKTSTTEPRQAAAALAVPELAAADAVPGLGMLKLKVASGEEVRQAARFSARPGVAFAEPNYLAHALEVPNDPGFSAQWGLSQIDAPAAWDVSHGSSAVIIAIVDTGIDGTHVDLAGKVLAGWNFVSPSAIPADSDSDDAGHGTHCAGIAAAVTNNSVGIAGLAPSARLMPVKVLDSSGTGSYEDVALGVRYAADHGARVINLSLGGTDPSDTLREAVNYALGRGCLLSCAAGNAVGGLSEYGIMYPAQYAMAVGATDSWDARAWFSKYGPQLSVVAPGQSIYSTLPGGFYGSLSGTSMAAPHVSGLAALLWGACPLESNVEVRHVIESTADDLGSPGWDQEFGYGRIDARAAIGYYISLVPRPSPLVFLADDAVVPRPVDLQVSLVNRCGTTGEISWTVALSPSVAWLDISPMSGVASSTQPIELQARSDLSGLAHGVYRCEVIVDANEGAMRLKRTIPVSLSYIPELYRSRLLLLEKDYAY